MSQKVKSMAKGGLMTREKNFFNTIFSHFEPTHGMYKKISLAHKRKRDHLVAKITATTTKKITIYLHIMLSSAPKYKKMPTCPSHAQLAIILNKKVKKKYCQFQYYRKLLFIGSRLLTYFACIISMSYDI